jgi:hypothetical protein
MPGIRFAAPASVLVWLVLLCTASVAEQTMLPVEVERDAGRVLLEMRWRLIPSDPEAYLNGELVEPETPIVYYMDPGIPEPYRSAYFEGGLWWNEVFEAAGFRNAFQIQDLPAGANPMDVRYPMIFSNHRRAPGPSVGPSHRDPRTGEILHTVVRMDTHRSLVDYNIYAGLLPAAGPNGLNVSAEDFAMARRRQHTAHEIGHTIGLAHNFIAGAQGRSSVMDYPVPLVRLTEEGYVDLSDAYAEGIGEFDKLAIRYAYTWFPDEESEREGLAEILAEMAERDQPFITGGHGGDGGSYPDATRWVEGNDMFSAYERTREVRRVLLEHFDDRALADDEPYVDPAASFRPCLHAPPHRIDRRDQARRRACLFLRAQA